MLKVPIFKFQIPKIVVIENLKRKLEIWSRSLGIKYWNLFKIWNLKNCNLTQYWN